MAGVKISALPVSPGLDGTEIVPLVDGGITRRTTVNAIVALAGSGGDINFVSNVPDSVYEAVSDDITLGVSISNDDATSVLLVRASDDGGGIIGTNGTSTLEMLDNDIKLRATSSSAQVVAESVGSEGQIFIKATGGTGSTTGGAITLEAEGLVTITGHGDINAVLINSDIDGGAVTISSSGVGNTLNVLAIGTGGLVQIGGSTVLMAESGGDHIMSVGATGIEIGASGSSVGFYNATPVAKQTGVAVTAGAIHAALVNLGLISA